MLLLIALMDTPGVKLTWKGSATSTLPILMSGLRLSPAGSETLPIDGQERTYVYEQTNKVPSYLLAIAGGELVFAVSHYLFRIYDAASDSLCKVSRCANWCLG